MKKGLLAGALLMALLVAWMALRAEDTAQKLQPLVPVQVTAIKEVEKQIAAKDPNAPPDALGDARNINALPPAPMEGLTEKYDGKILPVSRIQDDMTPFQAYKKPFKIIPGRALVSIVVVDYGLSERLSQSVLNDLPAEISLVLSPYAAEPAQWAASSRAFGHEFWLSLPMETKGFGVNDSGPATLLVNAPAEQNQQRLFSVLASAVGYAGLVSQRDHVFSQDKIDAAPILKQVFGRGLAFAESNPDIAAFGLPMAMEFGYPYVQNNFWLDRDLRPEALDAALRDLQAQAARKGRAVAFVRPYPVVIDKIRDWAKTADQNGIQIAPLSALVQ